MKRQRPGEKGSGLGRALALLVAWGNEPEPKPPALELSADGPDRKLSEIPKATLDLTPAEGTR